MIWQKVLFIFKNPWENHLPTLIRYVLRSFLVWPSMLPVIGWGAEKAIMIVFLLLILVFIKLVFVFLSKEWPKFLQKNMTS